MRSSWLFVFLLVVLSAVPATSSAALITQTYTFTAGGFNFDAPYASVTMVIAVTFDPSLTYSNAPSVVTSSASPAVFASITPLFDYTPVQEKMTLGGSSGGTGGIVGSTDVFKFSFIDATETHPLSFNFVYTVATSSSGWSGNADVTAVRTPEPAMLGLLALLIPVVGRKHRRLR